MLVAIESSEDAMLCFVQSFGDAYRLVDIAGIEATSLPFIVKNETGMHVCIKPDDSFEVINSFIVLKIYLY